VKDRETMVIGGLIRDNVVASTSKVPFLGDIPILGWFFKSKTTSIEKTNLMIFITPYIIKNEEEAGELTQRKNDILDEFRKEYRIEKKEIKPLLPPKEKTGAVVSPPEASSQTGGLPATEIITEPSGTQAEAPPAAETNSTTVVTAPTTTVDAPAEVAP
jgi:general secretion pathway protein D